MSVMSVVCFQIDLSATGLLHDQRNPTECVYVCVCVHARACVCII